MHKAAMDAMDRFASPGLRPTRQHGSALLSALIAFLVVSVGLLAMTRAQSQLRLSGDLARQRSDISGGRHEIVGKVGRVLGILQPVQGARCLMRQWEPDRIRP